MALEAICVRRAGRAVLTVPSLELYRGDRLAVVGPNGAGKSTLLQVMALLQPPSAGRVSFAGRPVRWREGELVRLRRRLGVVFQRPLLLQRSLQDNVVLALRLHGHPAATARSLAGEWLRRVGVAHLAERQPGQVSVGEAQRASLARALALGPDILLLDEPFAALDSLAREGLIRTLQELLGTEQCAVVFVTHDWREVRRLAGRVVALFEGRPAQIGLVADVEARPASPMVAGLIAAAS